MPTPDEFSNYQFGGSPKQGEYGQVDPGSTLPEAGDDMVPRPLPSKQFSSDVTGDPQQLLEETRANIDEHANMNAAYGLKMPVATLGSHPWLRDGLTNTSELEPGNESPSDGVKIPFKR